jgi:hypothetical protein
MKHSSLRRDCRIITASARHFFARCGVLRPEAAGLFAGFADEAHFMRSGAAAASAGRQKTADI